MKTAALKEVKAKLSEYCDTAQSERVLITKHGRPLALMVGVEGRDLDEVLTDMNPDFWRLVEERRRQPTLSAEEMRRRLGAEPAPRPQSTGTPRVPRKTKIRRRPAARAK
jgi:prevent-host-death family protein